MIAARAPRRAEPGAVSNPARRSVPLWGWVGALVFAAGAWALAADVPVVNAVWYLPAWYGYLLVVDAVVARAGGRSLVAAGPRAIAFLACCSIPFWFLFEAYNLRLHDWWYVFVLRQPWAEALVSVLAFATVLPACLLHAELLGALSRPPRPRAFRPRLPAAAVALFPWAGAACAIAPLVVPRFAFWMAWFVPFFAAEPVLAGSGAPSLLADAREGEYGRLARWALGGLWAGMIWELFNFWARSKWLYTVAGFDRPKLFEMPLAGYLGFAAFALSAFSFVSLARVVFPRGGSARAAIGVAAAILFCGVVLHFVLRRTVLSTRPVLSELAGLDAPAIEELERRGVSTPERLEQRIKRDGVAAVADSMGLERSRLERAAAEASLAVHKGMGISFARLLERAGVPDVAALSREGPRRLFERLRAAAAPGERLPPEGIVRIWVDAASADGRPRR